MSKKITQIEYVENTNNKFCLLLDLGGSTFRSILMNQDLKIKKNSLEIVKIRSGIGTLQNLVNLVTERIVNNIKNNLSDQRDYFLSVAGPVAEDGRTILQLTNVLPNVLNIALSDLVEKEVGKQTGEKINLSLINDGATGSVAEMVHGSAKGSNHSISLIIGTGIGGTDVIQGDGKVKISRKIFEPGHWVLDGYNNETLCNCGKCGCVETQAGGKYLNKIAQRIYAEHQEEYQDSHLIFNNALERKVNGIELENALNLQDEFANDILKSITKPIAILIRDLLMKYPDLSIVLVGGLAINLDEKYLNSVKNHLIEMFFEKERLDNCIKTGIIPPSITNFIGNMVLLKQEGIKK